jgi:hypothetical protein
MPESQDDEDAGYFPLVMTKKQKSQLAATTPTGNGTNGS